MAKKGNLHCTACYAFYRYLLDDERCELPGVERLEQSRDRLIQLSFVFSDAHKAFCRSKGVLMCPKCGNPEVKILGKQEANKLRRSLGSEWQWQLESQPSPSTD